MWADLGKTMTVAFGPWAHPAAANGQDWWPWGMHMMWGSWGIGMMIMMFLFWAAVIVALILLIRWLITSGTSGPQGTTDRSAESALDILQKRYARGEISKQEYEEMRRVLRESI